ncbi:MAG TPA: FMN-binding protein [Candidatus Anammoximicrobium sp.]|nr:FMN-binding protein [Candidatus Anammoximicrobium sp.]
MNSFSRTGTVLHSLFACVLLIAAAVMGCSGGDPPARVDDQPPAAPTAERSVEPPAEAPSAVSGEPTNAAPAAAGPQVPSGEATARAADAPAVPDMSKAEPAGDSAREPRERDSKPPAASASLDELLAKLVIPPPWLEEVTTQYDTSKPWKEARLEIRRLLGFGRAETHREAIKLTWIYLQKNDIGDGHEYPMYTFLGGEPVWSIRAHEEYLAKPHAETPIHAHLSLASLYAQYGEFNKAKATLDVAMNGLPPPPWDVMRKADVLDALGDLYVAWGKSEEAKRCYAEAAALYPTAKPPYGGHLLPRRAAQVQSKLDLMAFQSLATATLRDGQYQDKSLGYAGEIHVTLVVQGGKIADIRLKHEEKIDQNASVLIPQRIIEAQSLQVDGISGATVTKDAIVHGVYQCLKKAGLR